MRMLFAITLAILAVVAASTVNPALAQEVTGRWALCSVVQGPTFYSITSALLTSTSISPATYNGNANSFRFQSGTSCTGTRRFYNLSSSSTPALLQTATIQSLDNPGSVGGNSNYFFPLSSPKLDGDGMTFYFDVIPLIDGQPSTSAAGASRSMNLWFLDGQYAEETHSGWHQTDALTSSLSIVPVAVDITTYPTCEPAPSLRFSFCLVMAAQAYSVVFSGTFNTTGVAQRMQPTSSNQLTQQQQAVVVTGATGTRVYTDRATGTITSRSVTRVLPVNSFIGNTNYLYPAGPRTTDWNGIAFAMDGPVPIAGQSSTGSNVIMWYEQNVQQYIEEVASGLHESTPLMSSFTVMPLSPHTTTTMPACQVPPSISSSIIYYSFCSQFVSPTFSSVMSGMLTLQNVLLSTSAGRTYYQVTAASGSRTFTNRTTGEVTTTYIVSLAPQGSLGGNNNRLYTVGTIVDGDGLTFVMDAMPPIAGQPLGTSPTNQMNFWFGSSVGRYLEETAGGRHESTPTTSSVTVQPASAGAAVPVCTLPPTDLTAGESMWLMCSALVGTDYTSALSTVFVVNTTRQVVNGEVGFRVKRASGSRTFTSLVTLQRAQQSTYIKELALPGTLGNNDNYVFPLSIPVLNANGLTFHLNAVPQMAAQVIDPTSPPLLNVWHDSSVSSYVEDNARGRHEIPAVATSVWLQPYAPASLGVGPQCNLPDTIPISFCYAMVGASFTVRFSGVMSVSSLAVPIAPTQQNKLPSTQLAFTVMSAVGRREYANLTRGYTTTSNVVSMAPGFIGATNYVYFDNDPSTDWNGIAFNMDSQVTIAGREGTGNTFVLWWEPSVNQFIEEVQSGTHGSTPLYSRLTVEKYTGSFPTCKVPASAQQVVYFSFCSRLVTSTYTSVMSGVLTMSNLELSIGGKNAYLVVDANGTRTYTDATQRQVATILDVTATGSFGGNDNYLFYDSSPSELLNSNGLTFLFDRDPMVVGRAQGNEMNYWFDNRFQQYVEESGAGRTETAPLSSVFRIQQWTGVSSGVPSCVGNPGAGSTGGAASGGASAGAGDGVVNGAQSSDSSLSSAQIAGVVIGVVVGCALLVVIGVVMRMRRSTKRDYGTHDAHEIDESSHAGGDAETEMSQVSAA